MEKKNIMLRILAFLKYPLIGCLSLLGLGLFLVLVCGSIVILFDGTKYFTGFYDVVIRVAIFFAWSSIVGAMALDN